MIRYRIHDLVDVIVDDHIDPSVRRGIEFQIGAFGAEPGGPREGIPALVVRPYADFQRPSGNVREVYDMFSDFESFLDEPSRHLATERRGAAIYVYTNGWDFLVTLYIQLLLSESDVTLVHAAAMVDDAGRALLVAGAGGIGKTALVSQMVRAGWRILGDDVACLTADGRCLSFPRSFVLKRYHREQFPDLFRTTPVSQARILSLRALQFARANAPFLGITKSGLERLGLREAVARRVPPAVSDTRAIPITDLFGHDSVRPGGHLAWIVFLSRHSGAEPRWSAVEPEVLGRRLFAIIHFEISGYLRRLEALGAADLVDLPRYFGRVATAAERATARCHLAQLDFPSNAPVETLAETVLSRIG